jgi:ankyrin repeat protein
MRLSANVLNTGRDVIRSFTFRRGSNMISVSAIPRTMQLEIFGRLRPLFLSNPDGYPTINLEQAFGLTTKTPHLEFLKLAAYMLSNSISFGRDEAIGMKMIELCHSGGMLQILERLLADKQCTLRVMAEKLLVCAVRANDKMITRILLDAGASPKATFNIIHGDALTLATKLKRTELLPFLICAGARENEQATQLALGEPEDITFGFLLKLSLETSQPRVAKKLLEGYHHNIILEGDPDALLHHALIECDLEIIELVLNYEAGRLWEVEPLTLLEAASSTGSIEKVQLLLQNIGRIEGSGCGDLRKCLPHATRSGNLQLVEYLVTQGAWINAISSSGRSCLQMVDMNDLPMVRYLLDCGANPNHLTRGFNTPLNYAARSGNLAAVKLLLDYGASPISGRLGYQNSILRAAILSGNVAVVEEVLKAAAAADVWIEQLQSTALQLASDTGSIDIVRLLLSRNANINAPPVQIAWRRHSVTALTAALYSRNIQLVSYLLDQGADVNNPPAEHEAPSPLQFCIERLDYEMMMQLLTVGANPEDSGALWVAVCKKDLRSVNLLLDLNRKVLSKNHPSKGAGSPNYGRAALSEAIRGKQSQLVCTLLEAGVDFKRPPTQQFGKRYANVTEMSKLSPVRSATFAAIEAMNLKLLQSFLRQGKHCLRENLPESGGYSEFLLAMHSINFKHQDAVGILKLLNGTVTELNSYSLYINGCQTVLQEAISRGCCSSAVDYLLSVGANINSPASTRTGRTALQTAAERNRDDIVEILIRNGASVNAIASPYRGATAFQFAAMNGNFEIVQLLLGAGADAFAPRGKRYGRTAIEGAAENGRLDMVLYLLHLADGVDGIDFEHQLCRASRLAWNTGHIALSETILEHQEDRYGRLHCGKFERHDADFVISGDERSDDDDSSGEDDDDSYYSYISDIETDEQAKTGVTTTSFTTHGLPTRDLNVEELDSPVDFDSPNIHNIPTHFNSLRSSGEEDVQYEITENEITENYEFGIDDDPNLPECMRTLTQERENGLIVVPNQLSDEFLTNFLNIPGSMATPKLNEFEVTEKYQAATDNDMNPPETVEVLDQKLEDEPNIYPNLFPDGYLTDILNIPGSMATPRWDDFDISYDADMEE